LTAGASIVQVMDATTYKATIAFEHSAIPLPVSLHDHLSAQIFSDITVKYEIPFVEHREKEYCDKVPRPLNAKSVRLPSRIDSPLIPYPSEFHEFVRNDFKLEKNKYHASHVHQIGLLKTLRSSIIKLDPVFDGSIHFDVPSLKAIIKNEYSSRYQLINLTAMEFAKRATSAELSMCAMEPIDYTTTNSTASPYLSFLIGMQRMRVLICASNLNDLPTEYSRPDKTLDATLVMYDNGTYSYICRNENASYALIVAGNNFMIFHSNIGKWFSGNFTYLDYALTTADTVNNLEILSYERSYDWARNFFRLIIKLAEDDANHNRIVDFMKSFEGFMLNLSDYDESHAMSWIPILENSLELWKLDKEICAIDYPYTMIPGLLHNPTMKFNKKSNLCTIIYLCSKMTKTQIQELSSLHKFVFYAEVDAQKGVNKFLKRVHSDRPMEMESVKNIVRLAKVKFLLAYTRKHKCVPTLRGNDQKAVLIRMHYSRNDMKVIEEYPLTWWDDLKIWNCMDNTLTEDVLEFAKDKGALKQSIRHGPGDSRKELLQIIETPDYKLKALVPKGGFARLPTKIYTTCSTADQVAYTYPVRLIEKEREQKIEARLFANAELSNKHALSVIATKMKKALVYFDEQLMTPSDSSRKMMLHKNAQLLLNKNNYSILMDIEGHNQSMQFLNTVGLCEFLGELFGESDWRTLPNFFGALHVYHYDEYEDKVTVSEGQLGGIEGWLNPLWTLHTTLMMQLLRYMTDLDIPSIMVYSDDVNAIATIPQCTESTIQATFLKIMEHCIKFGMVAKMSQTNLSKHRATMLRQHYFKGVKADSTLKRLMSVSGVNNPMVMTEELEVAGICSSASSALENSNHSEACCFLKNYKLGVLLARYPHILLSKPRETGCLSPSLLPTSLANLLYNVKDHSSILHPEKFSDTYQSVVNDVARYLKRNNRSVESSAQSLGLKGVFGLTIQDERLIDHADRMLYLQIYDKFLMDFLFFTIYLPTNLGGMGGILHLNMSLSGHSVGMSKSIHYLHQWISNTSSNKYYFFTFLENSLSRSESKFELKDSANVVTTTWPSEKKITTCNASLQSAIKSMIKSKTKNINVLKLIDLSSQSDGFALDLLHIFKDNFHERIIQFYYENSAIHFFDLLINKIETSSGLLTFIRDLGRLRKSLVGRAMINLRIASEAKSNHYGVIRDDTNIISYLTDRRVTDYPAIKFIKVAEILYDNLIQECDANDALLTIRKTSPQFFKDGIQVYNDPRFGDEVLYKGEILDNDRLIGNKEELISARVCSITKWLLSKQSLLSIKPADIESLDCVLAANLCLKTLTGQSFIDLMKFCPDETGGEILHRIPNMRFSTKSYIRTELNDSLMFVAELTQKVINDKVLIDSNINFEYLRMRLIFALMVKNKFARTKSLITRYNFRSLTGVMDVQFITPKPSDHRPELKITPYSVFRKHEFSEFRFRFLASTYLTIEELTELSLIPNREIYEEYIAHGRSLMREIVYKYAISLDREYMVSNFKYPPRDAWKPIYSRLEQIDIKLQNLSDEEKHAESLLLLEEELSDRGKFYITQKRDKVEGELQMQCINRLYEQSPLTILHSALVERYASVIKKNLTDNLLKGRIIAFQEIIEREANYKRKLAIYIVCEAVIVMHFICTSQNNILRFDYKASIRQLQNVGILLAVLMNVNPDLYAKIQLIGPPVVAEVIDNYADEVTMLLGEISNDTQYIDMSVPTLHLSVSSSYPLDRDICLPEVGTLVEYTAVELGYNALETLSDLEPLMSYAEKCCQFASSPHVWESPTGSDNFCSQYGLFKMLKYKFDLDYDTRICNLTAGRGDGHFAITQLGLNCTSYSKPDRFTTLHHHPDILFRTDYDIFRTDTLTFVNDYDFVHIDISFLGQSNNDVSDCVLMLESLSIPYCIRLNSVCLKKYATSYQQLPVVFDHYLAYSSSNIHKTSEIYLIGMPAAGESPTDTRTLKQTPAFRAMALSYTQLLRSSYKNQILDKYCINSISETLPKHGELEQLIQLVCDKTVIDERTYYLQRYKDQYGCDNIIYLSANHMHPVLSDVFRQNVYNYESFRGPIYQSFGEEDIGEVREGIFSYHAKHLQDLQDPFAEVYKVTLGRQDTLFINKLRIFHPLYLMRGMCNVLLGIARVSPDVTDYSLSSIMSALDIRPDLRYIKTTKHQTDTINAIKLLVIAAYSGDASFGLKYCSVISIQHLKTNSEVMRVRFRYKQLSWLIPKIRELINDDVISLESVNVMADEIMTRKIQQSIQAQKYSKLEWSSTKERPFDQLDETTLVKLFESMEAFALNTELSSSGFDELLLSNNESMGQQIVEVQQNYEEMFSNIDFEIGVEQTIQASIDRLGLEINPVTGMYIGYEDIGEEDYSDGEY
jgi:hypothetical protein